MISILKEFKRLDAFLNYYADKLTPMDYELNIWVLIEKPDIKVGFMEVTIEAVYGAKMKHKLSITLIEGEGNVPDEINFCTEINNRSVATTYIHSWELFSKKEPITIHFVQGGSEKEAVVIEYNFLEDSMIALNINEPEKITEFKISVEKEIEEEDEYKRIKQVLLEQKSFKIN